MRGYVQYAQEDDDLNYMCLAVKLLERTGPIFTTLDVGLNWLQSIPFLWTWGPEHVVYLNLATAVGEHQPKDIDLEAIAWTRGAVVNFRPLDRSEATILGRTPYRFFRSAASSFRL